MDQRFAQHVAPIFIVPWRRQHVSPKVDRLVPRCTVSWPTIYCVIWPRRKDKSHNIAIFLALFACFCLHLCLLNAQTKKNHNKVLPGRDGMPFPRPGLEPQSARSPSRNQDVTKIIFEVMCGFLGARDGMSRSNQSTVPHVVRSIPGPISFHYILLA
jgi:hypothetical protein